MTATRRAAPRPCPGVCHVCPRVCHNVCHNVCALHACLVCESVSCVRVSSSAYMCVSPPYPCVCLLPSSPPRCFSWRAHVIHVPSSHTLTHRHRHTPARRRHDTCEKTTQADTNQHKSTHTHTRGHKRTKRRQSTAEWSWRAETADGRKRCASYFSSAAISFAVSVYV